MCMHCEWLFVAFYRLRGKCVGNRENKTNETTISSHIQRCEMNAQELNNEMETNMHETNRQGAIEKKREKKPLPFS